MWFSTNTNLEELSCSEESSFSLQTAFYSPANASPKKPTKRNRNDDCFDYIEIRNGSDFFNSDAPSAKRPAFSKDNPITESHFNSNANSQYSNDIEVRDGLPFNFTPSPSKKGTLKKTRLKKDPPAGKKYYVDDHLILIFSDKKQAAVVKKNVLGVRKRNDGDPSAPGRFVKINLQWLKNYSQNTNKITKYEMIKQYIDSQPIMEEQELKAMGNGDLRKVVQDIRYDYTTIKTSSTSNHVSNVSFSNELTADEIRSFLQP